MQFLGAGIEIKAATVTRALSASATLNFASTAADATRDLTITVTGAADGDFVILGIPNASMPGAGGCFIAWVSAADTVTVRFWNNTASSIDPGSGTFTALVLKAS